MTPREPEGERELERVPTIEFGEVPVIDGVATLPSGYTVKSISHLVRFPICPGRSRDDEPCELEGGHTVAHKSGEGYWNGPAIPSLIGPDEPTIDEAWREAEDTMGEYWRVRSPVEVPKGWEAVATDGRRIRYATAATPALALRNLTLELPPSTPPRTP